MIHVNIKTPNDESKTYQLNLVHYFGLIMIRYRYLTEHNRKNYIRNFVEYFLLPTPKILTDSIHW